MPTIIQDSAAGQIIRLVTNGRCLRYDEEKDPSIWHKFINLDKSSQLAYQGHIGAVDVPDEDKTDSETEVESGGQREVHGDDEEHGAGARRIPSRAWEQRGRRFQGLTGVKIDPEKGKDVSVIDWADENDPEVC